VTKAKRLFDIVGATLGLVLLWPVFIVVAGAVAQEDDGPVFFRQERVGTRGRTFRMWKFRTMVINAEQIGSLLTTGEDPRITVVGRWLRRAKLDELPQLINVLRGEMSLVGPRPEVPRYVSLYDDSQREVLALTPGITDPASLTYFDESVELAGASDPERFYVESVLPEKIRLNCDYAAHASVWTDFQVVAQTIGRLLGCVLAAPNGAPLGRASQQSRHPC